MVIANTNISTPQCSYHTSPILYTNIILSVCPTAIFVESGENAKPFIT
jgi:hypothetical protein